MKKPLLAAAATLLLASACSQPSLERRAKALERAVPRAANASVAGHIALQYVDIKVKGARTASHPFPVASAAFVVQPGAQRAALVGAGGDRVALTDHRIIYARRELNGPADRRNTNCESAP